MTVWMGRQCKQCHPGCAAAFLWCSADPGPYGAPAVFIHSNGPERSRVCSAPSKRCAAHGMTVWMHRQCNRCHPGCAAARARRPAPGTGVAERKQGKRSADPGPQRAPAVLDHGLNPMRSRVCSASSKRCAAHGMTVWMRRQCNRCHPGCAAAFLWCSADPGPHGAPAVFIHSNGPERSRVCSAP